MEGPVNTFCFGEGKKGRKKGSKKKVKQPQKPEQGTSFV